MTFDVSVNGRPVRVAIEDTDTPGRVQVSIEGHRRLYDVSWIDRSALSIIVVGSKPDSREFLIDDRGAGELRIATAGKSYRTTVLSDGKSHQRHPHRAEQAAVPMAGRQNVVATMPGRVVRVLVKSGDHVTGAQAVVVVEAMKMENEMRAPKDGVVRQVSVKEGEAIEAGTVLLVID
jgi:biotin carboxyl carrier protein